MVSESQVTELAMQKGYVLEIVVPIVDVHRHMDRDTPTPYHMARRFRDPLFYHFPLLRDIAQYIGYRILGRDRLSLLCHTESVSSFSVHLQ